MSRDGYDRETRQKLAWWEVQIDVAAVRVFPWDTETAVESHMAAEGLK